MPSFRTFPVLGVLFTLVSLSAVRPAAAADPLKVFCVARPPAADADEKTKKRQAEAPKAVADVASWLETKKKAFTVVADREAADLLVEISERHVPGFGPRSITFAITVGATPLETRAVKAGGTWTQVSGNLASLLEAWARKADPQVRAALTSRPQPVPDADRAALQQSFDLILRDGSW
jgi:hypothetical protein